MQSIAKSRALSIAKVQSKKKMAGNPIAGYEGTAKTLGFIRMCNERGVSASVDYTTVMRECEVAKSTQALKKIIDVATSFRSSNMVVGNKGGFFDAFFKNKEDPTTKDAQKVVKTIKGNTETSVWEKNIQIHDHLKKICMGQWKDTLNSLYDSMYVQGTCTCRFVHENSFAEDKTALPLNLYHVRRFLAWWKEEQKREDGHAGNEFIELLTKRLRFDLDMGYALFRAKGAEWGIDNVKDILNNCFLCVGRMETSELTSACFLPPMFVFNMDVGNDQQRVVLPLFPDAHNVNGVHFTFVSHPSVSVKLANLIRTVGKAEDRSEIDVMLSEVEATTMTAYSGILFSSSEITFDVNDCPTATVSVFGLVPAHQGKPSGNNVTSFAQWLQLMSLHEQSKAEIKIPFGKWWCALATKRRECKRKAGAGGTGESRKKPKKDSAEEELGAVNETKKVPLVIKEVRASAAAKKAAKAAEKEAAEKARFEKKIEANLEAFTNLMRGQMPKEIVEMISPVIANEFFETQKGKYKKALEDLEETHRKNQGIRMKNGKLKAAAHNAAMEGIWRCRRRSGRGPRNRSWMTLMSLSCRGTRSLWRSRWWSSCSGSTRFFAWRNWPGSLHRPRWSFCTNKAFPIGT